jgi:phosphoribosylformimino-5-aminoimidazole carboxamide ribotide isomerase
MQIVPVIDVYRTQAVRGIGGRRDEYRPVQSRLIASTDPLEVALAFREHFGLTMLYVADLDAIVDRRPHLELYRSLARAGFQTWVDAGVHSVAEAEVVAEWDADTVILGLESCPSLSLLEEFYCPTATGRIRARETDRLLFSLDLRNGVPITPPEWPAMTALDIVAKAVDAGFRRLLVLDLKDVGTNTGGGTDELLRQIRARWPQITLVAGGGVRGVDDLRRLSDLGVDAVLLASALHDGRLTREDLAQWM